MLKDRILPTKGRKYDKGKRDYSLLPFDALDEVTQVLEYGANKYERDNWKHVQGYKNRYFSAALRHLFAYAKGETKDPESGYSHLAHAACCILFMISKDQASDIHCKDAS